MTTVRVRAIVSLICLTMVIAGCATQQGAGQLAGAIAQAESLNFRFLRFTKNPDGKYPVMIQFNKQCDVSLFTEDELIDVFKTGVYPRTIGGGPVNVGFTFDFLAACNSPGELRFETRDLVAESTVTPGTYLHPVEVDIELSDGGVLTIAVFNVLLFGQNPARVKATGPITPTRIEVPGARVGGPQTATYSVSNVRNPYQVFNLNGIHTSPDRVAGVFAFTAKKVQDDNELLVVWDGDFVLRTDI